jgi:hypothetical protein
LKEATRREREYLDDLQNALKEKTLVIIVGAGVSLSATMKVSLSATGKVIREPLRRITWSGLIRNGLDYLVVDRKDVDASHPEIVEANAALENGDTKSVLSAAKIMRSQLECHGQYPTWLHTVFANLQREVRHPEILNVLKDLHDRGAKLVTTNYDDLLEIYCGLRHIGRSNKDELQRYKRGTSNGVFHVHGSYHDSTEVVLDTSDYEKIMEDEAVRGILKKYLEYNTILFIGCGSGLEDPNFGSLLKWASEQQINQPDRHYLLIRNDDKLNYRPLVRLRYGPEFEDLAPFLQKLLDDTFQRTHSSSHGDDMHNRKIWLDYSTDGSRVVQEPQTLFPKSDYRSLSQGSKYGEGIAVRSSVDSSPWIDSRRSHNISLPFRQGPERPPTNRKALSYSEKGSNNQVDAQVIRARTYVFQSLSLEVIYFWLIYQLLTLSRQPNCAVRDLSRLGNQPVLPHKSPDDEFVPPSDSLVAKDALEHERISSFDTSRTSYEKSMLTLETQPTRESLVSVSLSPTLLEAIRKTNPTAVRKQLEKGAKIFAQDVDGWCALHHAVNAGGKRVFRELLDSEQLKANPKGIDSSDKSGSTPLHYAAKAGKTELAIELLRAGANKDAADHHGRTPLFMAVQGEYVDLVELLLNNGAKETDDLPRRFNEMKRAFDLRRRKQDKAAKKKNSK